MLLSFEVFVEFVEKDFSGIIGIVDIFKVIYFFENGFNLVVDGGDDLVVVVLV